jgi:hypothetical protein
VKNGVSAAACRVMKSIVFSTINSSRNGRTSKLSSRTAVWVPPFFPSQIWGAWIPLALAIASNVAYDVQPASSTLLR